MYNFEQIVELFDEDQDVIRQALTLYFEKYGGDATPPYSDEVVGRLDEFFSLVNKNGNGGKILAAGSSNGNLTNGDSQQIESVLGTKGIALAIAIAAAREGRALARLHESVSRSSFNAETNKVHTELLDSLDNEATWLEDYSEDATAQFRLLKRLGIVQEESQFNAVLELRSPKLNRKRPVPYGQLNHSGGNTYELDEH